MSDQPPVLGPVRLPWLLVPAVAAALGFLGANPFADAVGFPQPEPRHEEVAILLRVLCGLLVGVLAFTATLALIRLTRVVADRLGRVTDRPPLAVVLTWIIAGAVCILLVLGAEVYFLRAAPIPTVQLSETSGSVAALTVRVQVPFVATVVAIFAFLAGIALVALGVWGGLQAGQPQGPQQMPAAPPLPPSAAGSP